MSEGTYSHIMLQKGMSITLFSIAIKCACPYLIHNFLHAYLISRHKQVECAMYNQTFDIRSILHKTFVCVEVLWPSQPNGVMSSAVSLPNHTFTRQA